MPVTPRSPEEILQNTFVSDYYSDGLSVRLAKQQCLEALGSAIAWAAEQAKQPVIYTKNLESTLRNRVNEEVRSALLKIAEDVAKGE